MNDHENEYLIHFGTKGMKWGKRLYQNKDGSLTALGKVHYAVGSGGDTYLQKKATTAANIHSNRVKSSLRVGGNNVRLNQQRATAGANRTYAENALKSYQNSKLVKAIDRVEDTVSSTKNKINTAAKNASTSAKLASRNASGAATRIAKALTSGSTITDKSVARIKELTEKANAATKAGNTKLAAQIDAQIERERKKAMTANSYSTSDIEKKAAQIGSSVKSAVKSATDTARSVSKTISDTATKVRNTISSKYGETSKAVSDAYAKAKSTIVEKYSNTVNTVASAKAVASSFISELKSNINDLVGTVAGKYDEGVSYVNKVIDAAEEFYEDPIGNVSEKIEEIQEDHRNKKRGKQAAENLANNWKAG